MILKFPDYSASNQSRPDLVEKYPVQPALAAPNVLAGTKQRKVRPTAHRAHVSVINSVFEVQIFYKSAYNDSKPRKHAALWSWKNAVVG